MDDRSPDLLRPTLTAGLSFGLLAGLPFLECLCCVWVLACGFAASWLYGKESARTGAAFRPGGGAMAGLIAGAFYAMTQTLASALSHMALGSVTGEWLLKVSAGLPNVPEEQRAALEEMVRQPVTVPSILLGFFTSVLVAAVFSTLGGLVGGFTFARPAAPAGPPPPAPPAGPWDSPSGP